VIQLANTTDCCCRKSRQSCQSIATHIILHRMYTAAAQPQTGQPWPRFAQGGDS
jgi:hypothetical protein